MRRLDEAITTCRDAAAIYRETGDRHGELGRSEEAGGVYEQVVARVGDDTERAVRERVAMARQMKAEINGKVSAAWSPRALSAQSLPDTLACLGPRIST